MRQAVNERIGQSLPHYITLIVIALMTYIEHRLFYKSHTMTQQIDSHHGYGIAVFTLVIHILRIGILGTKVLAETQRLSFKPCFLKLNEY